MIDIKPVVEEHNEKAFEDFIEYGRMRRIIKSIDDYGVVYEHNRQLYAALSTGQTVALDKFRGIKSEAVKSWIEVLYTIGKGK